MRAPTILIVGLSALCGIAPIIESASDFVNVEARPLNGGDVVTSGYSQPDFGGESAIVAMQFTVIADKQYAEYLDVELASNGYAVSFSPVGRIATRNPTVAPQEDGPYRCTLAGV